MFARLYRLTVKELLAATRDPKARLILIVPPILQLFLFAFALTQEVRNVRLGVLNFDAGIEGAAMLKSFESRPVFREIVSFRTRGEIDKALDERRIIAALIVPDDFSKRLLTSNETAKVQLILDGRRANAASVLGGYMLRIVGKFSLRFASENASVGAVSIEQRNWFNPNLTPRDSFLPGLVCLLATVVGTMVSGLSIARERETGTFEQLLVSPASPMEIVFGKAFAAVLLATCSALVVSAIVVFGFGLSLKGAFWLLPLSLVVYLSSVVGVGLFVSSLAATQQQAILGCFLVMPPAIMLSGFATPVENMPSWLQTLMVANPLRWFLIISKGVFLRGTSPAATILNLLPILATAAVSLTGATLAFKRRME